MGNRSEGGQKRWSKKSVRKVGLKVGLKVEAVFALIKANPTVTRDELSKELNMAPSSIQRYIDILKIDRIRRIDGDRGGYWKLLK
jgi:predicted transcriptional regulator